MFQFQLNLSFEWRINLKFPNPLSFSIVNYLIFDADPLVDLFYNLASYHYLLALSNFAFCLIKSKVCGSEWLGGVGWGVGSDYDVLP